MTLSKPTPTASAGTQPYRVGAYLRAASSAETPEVQRERITRHAQGADPGGRPWQVVAEYTETADGSARRRLLEDARAGKLDRIAVSSLDRLIDGPGDLVRLWTELSQHGVHLVAIEEGLETDTPAGAIALRVAHSLAGPGSAAAGGKEVPSGSLGTLPIGVSSLEDYVEEEGSEPEVSEEDRAGLEVLLNAREAAISSANLDVILSQEDFPVVVLTDTTEGEFMVDIWDEQRYRQVLANGAPPIPNARYTQENRHLVFLTPTLALCTQDDCFTFPDGKAEWRSANLFVKRNGEWKTKAILEGGIGESLEKAGMIPTRRLV